VNFRPANSSVQLVLFLDARTRIVLESARRATTDRTAPHFAEEATFFKSIFSLLSDTFFQSAV